MSWIKFLLSGLRYAISNGKVLMEVEKQINQLTNQPKEKEYIEIKPYGEKSQDYTRALKSIAMMPEYQFFMYDLRATIVEQLEKADSTDTNKLIELTGQLKILKIATLYLEKKVNNE